MKDEIGRREFMGKAILAASAIPVLMHGAAGKGHAQSGPPAPVGAKATKSNIKRIGLEEHWSNAELNEIGAQWRARTGSSGAITPGKVPPRMAISFQRLGDFDQLRLPLMDQNGISMQVLALSSPGVQALTDSSKAIDLAKRTNDFQAEVIRKHPDRFAGFAALPTQDPKAAADELERTVKQLGFKGAMVQGHTNWEYLDEQKYRVIWERAAGLEVPIYLHISDPSADSKKMYGPYTELTGIVWGIGVETATHALRIIMSGVFDAYPKATLILGHLGESLPYLLGRIDEGYEHALSFGVKKLNKPASQYLKENVLVTTSGLYRPEALICAIAAMGSDRVLFSVDYPFVEPKTSVEFFERTPMSDSDREKVSHLNAERWLRL
jgi:2,3-dihydroxybenzoate decarboxylase